MLLLLVMSVAVSVRIMSVRSLLVSVTMMSFAGFRQRIDMNDR
jgi:hypothetical protein